MSDKMDRRNFLTTSAIAGATAAAFNFEETALLAKTNPPTQSQRRPQPKPASGKFPSGKIGNLNITRLICGGNLTSGFAHSRDLIYVSSLLQHYFTDEKIYETWQICAEQGIDSMLLRVDEHVIRLVKTYRKEYGVEFNWLAQCKITEDDIMVDIQRAIDNGAVAAYVHGGVADKLVSQNQVDLLGKAVDIIKKNFGYRISIIPVTIVTRINTHS